MIDLQAGWNPDVEHTDVYCRDHSCGGNHDHLRAMSIWYDEANSVDDDLEEKLDLNTPAKYWVVLDS